MLLPLIAGTLAFFTQAQGQSVYRQIVAQPDPRNGYEDYLKAADLARDPSLTTLLNWNPGQYQQLVDAKKDMVANPQPGYEWDSDMERELRVAEQLRNENWLSIRQKIANYSQGMMELVRAGNGKQVWDPRKSVDPATVFPEYTGFKTIAKVIGASAYAKFAAGDSRGGTQMLLDGYTFSIKMSNSTLIGELVSAASRAIILASFEEELGRMSDDNAKQIIRATDSLLKEKPSMIAAWTRERDLTLQMINEDLIKNIGVLEDDESDQASAMQAFYNNLSPMDQRAAVEESRKYLAQRFDRMISRFSQPEETWTDPLDFASDAPNGIHSMGDFAQNVARMFTPVFAQANTAFMMRRTQLRLLNLHARIIDYRWQHNRLPDVLGDAVPRALMFDPLGKEAFHYEPREDGYRLYSRGTQQMGSVELKYKRTPGATPGDDKVPPPLMVSGQRAN